MPKRKKRKVKSLSTQDSINKARDELLEANNLHTQSSTAMTKEKVRTARTRLQTAYDIATAEEHSAAWKAMNEITGRKDKPTVTVQGGTADKRN